MIIISAVTLIVLLTAAFLIAYSAIGKSHQIHSSNSGPTVNSGTRLTPHEAEELAQILRDKQTFAADQSVSLDLNNEEELERLEQ